MKHGKQPIKSTFCLKGKFTQNHFFSMRHGTSQISYKILVVLSFVFLFVLNKERNPAVSVCSKCQAMAQLILKLSLQEYTHSWVGFFWGGVGGRNMSENIA